jgi:MOSC domain-containing protein YiiM
MEPISVAHVLAVSASPEHGFSKASLPGIQLVAGMGVDCDTHSGVTVQHRSRVARDPSQPNLRQVHLLHAELFDELAALGFDIAPGELGENVTTRGLDLLALPENTELRLGADAVVRITGLRNPCAQLDGYRPGLTAAVLGRTPGGELVRKAGVMGVVLSSGVVQPGDAVLVQPAPLPHRALRPV